MEYKSEDETGDSAWYKLVGDRTIPVKVRTINMNTIVVQLSEQVQIKENSCRQSVLGLCFISYRL